MKTEGWSVQIDRVSKHHIFPKALGGSNRPENIVLIPQSIHDAICDNICTRREEFRIPKKQRAWWKGQLRRNYQIGVREHCNQRAKSLGFEVPA